MKRYCWFLSLLMMSKVGLAQIPEARIKDSTFLIVINKILDSANVSEKQKRVLTIHITDLSVDQSEKEVPDERFGRVTETRQLLNYDLMAILDSSGSYFNYHMPDFYFFQNGCLVFVYLGGELFSKPNEKSNKQIGKLLRDQGLIVESAKQEVFWINVRGKEYKFIPNKP